ncbi:hypothetical protein C0992_001178 [Termitomyces sp. T32_za158]|nr:hypothetical protein C0992_001178 [Termitomyces sp. T32_za158]
MHLVHKLVHGFILGAFSQGFKTHAEAVAGVQEERESLGGGMDMVVVLEFGLQEELVPVILVLVPEESEVPFKLLVDAFGLAVRLQVVGSGHMELDVEDVGIGEAMEFPYVLPIEVGGAHGRASGVSGDEGVIMLLDNVPTKFQVVGNIDMAMEGEEAELQTPLIGAYGSSSSSLLRSKNQHGLGHRILLNAFAIASMDILEDVDLLALHGHSFKGVDGKQLWAEKDYIGIVPSPRSMVGAAGECIGLLCTLSGLVVQGEVEVG